MILIVKVFHEEPLFSITCNCNQLQPLCPKLSAAGICPGHEHSLLFLFWSGKVVQVFLLHGWPVQEAARIEALEPGGKEPHSRPRGSLLPGCKAALPTWAHVYHCESLRRVLGEAFPLPDADAHPSASFQRETTSQVGTLQCYFARIRMNDRSKSPLSLAPTSNQGLLEPQLYSSRGTWEALYKNLRY